MPWLALAGWILVAFLAALIGGLAGAPGAWYAGLAKPAWNPPNWVFGPVWTVLYATMGVAAWLIWLRRADTPVQAALTLFGIQLVLNALWSWVFFGWHWLGLAFVELLLMWVAILATTVAFWRIRPLAGWLFLPYLLWVAFAGVLNLFLWRLNR
jgi:tryptophan-rich sensory protein